MYSENYLPPLQPLANLLIRFLELRTTRLIVLFVDHVLALATGATGLYLIELADAFAARGFAVDVLTGPAPGALPRETRPKGVAVRKSRAQVGKVKGAARRALSHVAFFPDVLTAARQGPPPNVIVLKTEPQMLAALGPALRRFTGARVVLWAQEVYPEVAEALGASVPVLTTMGAPWSELIDHRCGWWTATATDAIAELLEQATSTDRAALGAIDARGQALVRDRYGWDHAAGRMQDVYAWISEG